MSNGIRYDSLLVRDLAAELDERLRGRPASVLRLDPGNRTASLELDDRALVLDLHPERGWIVEAAPPAAPSLHRLHRDARIGRIHAPDDERVMRIELAGGSSATRPIRAVVVELMTNQWNVIALAENDRVVSALRQRGGAREIRAGARYQPPPPDRRLGADGSLSPEAWGEAFADEAAAEPEGIARTLVGRVAYTSPLNAPAIVSGDAGADAASPAAALDRWRALVHGPRTPVLLDGGQPYPVPLPGVAAEETTTLLRAMTRAAEAAGVAVSAPTTGAVRPETLDRLRYGLARLDGRLEALEREIERARPEAESLRARGDLLLARLRDVPRGASAVRLDGFDGEPVEIELDPALSAADNAQALYAAARRRSKAADTLPARIGAARRKRDELAELLRRAEAGEADAEEVEAAAPSGPERGRGSDEETLPYRRYTTTGGLEVRVGRSSRANDELTFHHSSPNDIWLHARDAAGAHVILRWGDADANPPKRDLTQAAVLAALNSRARTSGTVPVDWARRKHVRKPRKAPPGAVLPSFVSTVFVVPDEKVERAMRPGA